MRGGWYQVAFERELTAAVNAVAIERPLMAVRAEDRVRVFDAVCPHRGAHLGHGGTVEGGAIVCPFHGRRIGLGVGARPDYCVREYVTLSIGGIVLACLAPEVDRGLPEALQKIDRDHYIIPGFSMTVPVPAELVIENAFDASHFQPVHSLRSAPSLTVVSDEGPEVRVEGTLMLPRSLWQSGSGEVVSVPYTARGFSPGIVLGHMGGEHPYYVLTAATPLSASECLIRQSIAVPPGPGGNPPDAVRCEYTLTRFRDGITKDLAVWRHLSLDAPARYAPEDAPVIAFRKYVAQFTSLQ